MSAPGSVLLLVTWVASALPLALSHWVRIVPAESEQAFLGLVLLPWMALVGLPRSDRAETARRGISELVLAAPLLALAFALDDHRSGRSILASEFWTGASWAGPGIGIGLLLALYFGASRAGAKSRWHAALWMALVIAAPCLGWLAASLTSIDSTAIDSTALAESMASSLANWSPLTICWRLATDSSSLLTGSAVACSTAGVLLLIAAAEFDRRRA